MTTSKLGEDIVRLLLVTPRGSLWDTVRPMTLSHDDALAVMGVTILAQSVVDARLVLDRCALTDQARAQEIEAVIRGLMR
jgi:hypothetical protein